MSENIEISGFGIKISEDESKLIVRIINDKGVEVAHCYANKEQKVVKS